MKFIYSILQPQGIVRLLEYRIIDNRIYCKLERDTFSEVLGQPFDLRSEPHHLLLAGGLFFDADSISFHLPNSRNSTMERVWLTTAPGVTPPETTTTTTTQSPEDPIYDGCGTRKLCFGIPNLCFNTRNCRMLATVFYNDDEEFEFELLGQCK